MGIIHLNENEMASASKSFLNGYREALAIGANCEYDGHFFDVIAFDDGSTYPFKDRCKFALEQAFLRGRWDVICISSNLSAEANAFTLKIVSDQMCEYFRDYGEDANVLFNERRLEMKYVLKPERAPDENNVAAQEHWLEQLGIVQEAN